jgi:hypothetical protein
MAVEPLAPEVEDEIAVGHVEQEARADHNARHGRLHDPQHLRARYMVSR